MNLDDHLAHERGRFVEDLLSYMTLEEKLGQLDLFHSPDDPALEKAIVAGRIGGVAGASLSPRYQGLATERSRLGIPLLLANPAIDLAGSPWALAASWDEDLVRSVGASTAREAIGGGFNCVFAPRVADLATRSAQGAHLATTEPHLSARLGTAFAQGAGGEGRDNRGTVLAVPAWDAAPGVAALSWALDLVHAGDVAAIECQELDRHTAQRAGFTGILIAECARLLALFSSHFSNSSTRSTIESAERIIADGVVSDLEIDTAVRGVLAAKHRLGLFRDPDRIVSPPQSGPVYARDDQRVRGTFVLLRNEAGLLPLSPVSDRVLVVGAAEGVGGACADALGRAGIGHSLVPGLAQRRVGESWTAPVAGDHFALSLTCDAARRADFVLVVLEDRHFAAVSEAEWRQPTSAVLSMLRGVSLTDARLVAIIATREPVDLADADQHFVGVLQCWQPTAGFEEALSDVLSGRFSPQGRMPATAGRFVVGHGMGFGESVVSGYRLTAGNTHIAAAARVRNSGSFESRETVQVYARGPNSGLRLIDFRHIQLAPGEDAAVTFELGLDALGVPGTSNRLELEPGPREILIGKSKTRLLSATIEITPALARTITLRESGYLRLAAG